MFTQVRVGQDLNRLSKLSRIPFSKNPQRVYFVKEVKDRHTMTQDDRSINYFNAFSVAFAKRLFLCLATLTLLAYLNNPLECYVACLFPLPNAIKKD